MSTFALAGSSAGVSMMRDVNHFGCYRARTMIIELCDSRRASRSRRLGARLPSYQAAGSFVFTFSLPFCESLKRSFAADGHRV